MFMTKDEVAQLTGRARPKEQTQWLESQRFGFVVGADGKPKVLREVVLARLGATRQPEKKGPELRF